MDRRSVCFALLSTFCFYLPSSFADAPVCTNKHNSSLQIIPFSDIKPVAQLTATEEYVAKMFLRLTGAPPSFFDPRYRRAVNLMLANQAYEAAQLITADNHFLKIRLRNFSIPFINKDFQPKDTLTDLQTLIIGTTRDDEDARLILTGNIRYQGYSSLNLPPVSRANNDHFAEFESRGLDFDRDLQRVNKQWDDQEEAAGALTTRAWAAAYYNAGTNRLAVKFSIDSFLCQPIDTWKIRGLTDDFVRRDISRAPGGDPAIYQNDCRNCHSAMDGFGGAFARLDFVDGQFNYIRNSIAAKMNNNAHFYPPGFVTSDDSWVNLITRHPTIDFGWRGDVSGMGVASFAKSLAESAAFGRCMVQKVFSEVCGTSIQVVAPNLLQSLASDFENSGYRLRHLFAQVATQDACLSHPQKELQ